MCNLAPLKQDKGTQMLRFLGTIEAKTDGKGRVFIPSSFRRRLQEAGEAEIVLRKDIHQDCLVLYPESVWFKTQDTLRARLNIWDAADQSLFRRFVSGAEIAEPDSNGRILLSKRLIQLAEIKDTVVFVGMGEEIEIWAKDKWEQQQAKAIDLSADLERKMAGCQGSAEDISGR